MATIFLAVSRARASRRQGQMAFPPASPALRNLLLRSFLASLAPSFLLSSRGRREPPLALSALCMAVILQKGPTTGILRAQCQGRDGRP